jgi:hypothetical protein
MDDVAVMSKVETKKRRVILGDDLAVNAEKASGFISENFPFYGPLQRFLNKQSNHFTHRFFC